MKNHTMRNLLLALLLLALGTAGWTIPVLAGNAQANNLVVHPAGFSDTTKLFLTAAPSVVQYTGVSFTNGSLTVELSGEVANAGDVSVYDPSGKLIETIHFPITGQRTQQLSYSYTINNVKYPAAAGTHVFTAKSGRVNGTKLEASASVAIRPVITITTNKTDLCAGKVIDALHQVVITVSAKTATGLPVPGYAVNIALTYGNNKPYPKCSLTEDVEPTFFVGNETPQKSISGVTGTNGEFQCTMQAGKLVLSTVSYGVVNINVMNNTLVCATIPVNIGEPTVPIDVRDANNEEVEWFYYGDEITLNGTISFNGNSVQNQPVTWSFKYWSEDKNPKTDLPTYTYAPGNDENDGLYGYIDEPDGVTDANGQSSSIYTGGYAIGYYTWYMIVNDVFTAAK